MGAVVWVGGSSLWITQFLEGRRVAWRETLTYEGLPRSGKLAFRNERSRSLSPTSRVINAARAPSTRDPRTASLLYERAPITAAEASEPVFELYAACASSSSRAMQKHPRQEHERLPSSDAFDAFASWVLAVSVHDSLQNHFVSEPQGRPEEAWRFVEGVRIGLQLRSQLTEV